MDTIKLNTLWNGFFDTKYLTLEQKKCLLKYALSVCLESRVDVLKSFRRERYDMSISPENFIQTLDVSDIKLIDRLIYRGFKTDFDYEISVISKNEDGHPVFLWLYVSLEDFYDLVDEYKLPKILIKTSK